VSTSRELREPAPLAAPVLPPVDEPFSRVAPFATARNGACVAGLCAGVARRLGADVGLVRVPLAVLALLALVVWWPLALALGCAYVLLWLVLPREDALPLLHEFEF
jgi:phage shock protein PspC (stress-responsive transcriptional regulator)